MADDIIRGIVLHVATQSATTSGPRDQSSVNMKTDLIDQLIIGSVGFHKEV